MEDDGSAGLRRPAKRSVQNADYIALLHDDAIVTIKLGLWCPTTSEPDAVAGLKSACRDAAVIEATASADGDDFAPLRFIS